MFEKSCEELFETLGEHQIMVLATCANNRVTARTMSFILHNNKFYFQTGSEMLKYSQMLDNPKVAICYNNIQIEGISKILGHPLDENNSFFANRYKEHYKGSFEKYTGMASEVLIEVIPQIITLWCYDYEGKPYRKFIDFTNNTVKIEYCDILK